jgi:hypothetical protein
MATVSETDPVDAPVQGENLPADAVSDAEPASVHDAEFDLSTVTAEAPFGYLRDPKTGEVRPKKRPGRTAAAKLPTNRTPTLDELKGAAASSKQEDVAPSSSSSGRKQRRLKAPKAAPAEAPAFRAGPIAKGMNKNYMRAGKILRVWDPMIGEAVISCTRKEADDDVTVGEAWEELARGNPRIRAFLMRLVAGGAWGSLAAAHAPIFLAILMKDSVSRRFPMARVAATFLSDDETASSPGGPSDLSQALGGLSPEDLAEMMMAAQNFVGDLGAHMPREPSTPRPPVVEQWGEQHIEAGE